MKKGRSKLPRPQANLNESGVNHLAVAELMGYANGQMVASVYGHMDRASAHLKEALKRVRG